MTPPPVHIPHHTGLLLALHRVRGGQVTVRPSGSITDHSRPFPDLLVPFLRELLDHGQVRLESPEEGSEGLRVVITKTGERLFGELIDDEIEIPLRGCTRPC
jgi:hypothetical protein